DFEPQFASCRPPTRRVHSKASRHDSSVQEPPVARFAHFLRCVGRAFVKNGARALLSSVVSFGDIAFDIARDTYEDYRKGHGERDLRAELEGLAQASPPEVRRAAEAVATQEAAGQPAEVRQALTSYLTQ